MRKINIVAIIAMFIILFGCGGGGGGSSTTMTAEENPDMPVADAGGDQTVYEDDLVTLDGSKSLDTAIGIVSYTWSQISGPAAELSNAEAIIPTFVAPKITANSAGLIFKLTIKDEKGRESATQCTITILKKNQLPNADAGPNQTVTVGSTVILDGSNSTDSDGGIASYTWAQTGGTTTVTLSGSTTSQVSFVAPDSPTSLTFTLTVRDAGGQSDTATCIVNVTSVANPNQSPTAEAGVNQTVVEGATVTLNGSNSSDPDGTIVSYSWTQTDGSPTVELQNAQTASPTFTAPNPGTSGTTLTFMLTVTDDDGSQTTDYCTVNITAATINNPPTANAGADQNVAEYATVTLNGSASTDDNGIATYSWTRKSGPSVTLSDPTAAKPTFKAPALGSVALVFELTVTDAGGLSATDECIVNVTSANMPTANAGPDQSVESGALVTLDGSSSADVTGGSIVSYSWVQTAGATATLSSATGAQATFTAPDPGTSAATYTFQLTVTDNDGLTAVDSCTITVTPVAINNPPTANAGVDQSVAEGTSVTLDASASTDDAGIAAYSWSQKSGLSVTLLNTTGLHPSFTAPQIDSSSVSLVFVLTVTDTGGLTATDEVTVVVTGQNDAPTAEAGANQTVVEGATVTLSGIGSDPESGTLTYTWTQTSGPSVTLSNAAAASPSFTAPSLGLTSSATLTFRLIVTDAGGLMASDTCTVTINRSGAHMAQDALFTAYAGIGYMTRDSITDNEVLFNVMVEGINSLITQLADNTVQNDTSRFSKMTALYWGTPQTFVWNATGFKCTVYMSGGADCTDPYSWHAYTVTLSLDFNANGYTYRNCKYTGTSGVTDITATLHGYSKITNLLTMSYDTVFRSVDITANNAFTAQYSGAAVKYNNYNIAYTVSHGSSDPVYSNRSSGPLNVYMIPSAMRCSTSEQVDNRDYTLGGSFTINGNTYQVGTSFHYQQYPYTYLVNNVSTTRILVSINGSLAVPGMSSLVTIQTPYSATDPVGTNTIYKTGSSSANSGIWTAGQMSITGDLGGTTTTETATFTSGSAAFSGGLGSWTVSSWQDALVPF